MRHGHILQELQVVCEAKAKGTKQGLAKDETGKVRSSQIMEDHNYAMLKSFVFLLRDVIKVLNK